MKENNTMAEQAVVKSCVRCEQTKHEAAFVKIGHGRRGATCLECRNERRRARGESSKRRAAETPEERRTRRLWEQYRLTDEQYQCLLASQGGGCAICHKKPTATRPLDVDHCHLSGVVRALLCNLCNLQIGVYEQTREAAAKYLATYGSGNPLLRK